MSSPTPVRPVKSEEPNPTLYNDRTLKVYDAWVCRFSHRFVWRCPYKHVRALYEGVGRVHVEVGPGTGLALAKLASTTPLEELHLLDLNQAPLTATQKRIGHRFTTHPHTGGALKPWPLGEASVDSVGASLLVHCLPGDSVWDKHDFFDNAAAALRDGGQFFGATYLGRDALGHTRAARRLLSFYNGKQNTMHNEGDTLTDLARLLFTHPEFTDVWIDTSGSVVLWRATRAPRVGGEQA